MGRTMTLYETSRFEHKEKHSVHYQYISLSAEYEIAAKLGKECTSECFIVIIDNDGAPIKSLDC